MKRPLIVLIDDGPPLPLAASITLTPADYKDDAPVWEHHSFSQTYTSQWGFKAERITYLKRNLRVFSFPLLLTLKRLNIASKQIEKKNKQTKTLTIGHFLPIRTEQIIYIIVNGL